MKLVLMYFSPSSFISFFLGPNMYSAAYSCMPSASVIPLMRDSVQHLCKTTHKIVFLYIVTLQGSEWEYKRFWTE